MSTVFTDESLPKRFDFQEAHDRLYEMWETNGYFRGEADPNKKPYTIVIPPPNVTGALHLGHALNNSLQDIMIRMKRMQGYAALWMPGTDHAGIATQAVVERRLDEDEGLNRHDLGREKLVDRIWDWKAQYEKRILGQLKKMGTSCDWSRTRFTLDPVCARAVRETFFDLFKKKLIYRGKRLVNWDTKLQTAVSDDEVFYKMKKGHFWHFRYPVIDPKPGEPTHVTIATTRPETMLGDTAVAVHPDPAGALDAAEKELKEKLADAAAKEIEGIQKQLDNIAERRTSMLGQLETLRDMAADGRMLMLPLLERPIPLVADNWAKPELGSGCVKITPAHDPNDYEVGKRCNLEMLNILNRDGTLNTNAGQYKGLTIPQSRKKVVADLEEAGLLGDVEDRDIDLAHSDRSKMPIEPYLADQWFIKMDTLAQSAMDAVEDGRVTIFPKRYTKGYLDWLGEKRDWPVSRQLWWGHQIPVWSKQCNDQAAIDALTAQLEADEAITSGIASYTIELSEDAEGGELDPIGYAHVCVLTEDDPAEARFTELGFTREVDVLDTWFSSALWPHSTLGWPEKNSDLDYFYPTSTLITSRDIITLWVARMVLMGLNNMNEIPFSEVFIHPKILDGDGEGMSKSKGNGVDPIDVMNKFGADALRFGLAYLTTENQDVRMPVQFECPQCESAINQTKKNRQLHRIECPKCKQPFGTQWAESEEDKALPMGAVISERFELSRNFTNKLWNASRFALLNLEGFEPGAVSDDELAVEDRWLLSRLSTVTATVTESLDRYQFADAARALYEFAWDDFCSFYVEILKDRFQDTAKRPIAQRVLAHALDTLLRLLHPMIPYITEEVWQLLGQAAPERGLDPEKPAASIMIASWPEADAARQDPAIEAQFALFQTSLGALREIRSRQNIAPKAKIELSIKCDDSIRDQIMPMQPYYASMSNGELMACSSDVQPPDTAAAIKLEQMEVYVDLKDFIDVDAERARLEGEEKKLTGQIKGKEAKLGNEKFVSRAPEAVVEKERQQLAQLREKLAAVIAALAKLPPK
jgi:valyl-tRNA synthetase